MSEITSKEIPYDKGNLLGKVEDNGLIIISIGVSAIYWLFDSQSGSSNIYHMLIVFLFVYYGTFIQRRLLGHCSSPPLSTN